MQLETCLDSSTWQSDQTRHRMYSTHREEPHGREHYHGHWPFLEARCVGKGPFAASDELLLELGLSPLEPGGFT